MIDARDRRPVVRLAGWLPPIAAGALALATGAGFLSAWWWVFDLFVHFRPHLAAAGLVLALAALALRRRGAAVAAVLLAAVNLAPVLPYLGPAAAQAAAPSANLRVLTFNLHGESTDPAALRALVEAEDPDLVVLTELPRDMRPVTAALGRGLPHRLVALRYTSFDIGLFSRWRLGEARVDRSVERSFPVVYADVCNDAAWAGCVRVVALHASRPFRRTPGGYADARPWQDGQLALAERFAAEAPDGRALVVGDLNLTPWSPRFGTLLDRGGLYDTARGRRLSATWASPLPFIGLMIDHVLASPGIVAVDSRVGPDLGSDHRPVVADLAVPVRLRSTP
ncbi:MAG: endonuclease/exonuclease/phosphatase family protein [Rhodospirillales bacterium]